MTDSYGFGHSARGRGSYGTNKGDCWLGTDSPIQRKLDAEGKGLILVHEIVERDGGLQEGVYVTEEPELIERAKRGHEFYVAERAARN